ncbi:GCN5-related N-acetyltransferase 7, chloroplastic [Apium graveolens]|uniref:GCN5-related N-acetyltransferase 7, chloroplastic n=1 Tax=Apium graveolens TaxID=4045 RepID=UPI003D7BFE11
MAVQLCCSPQPQPQPPFNLCFSATQYPLFVNSPQSQRRLYSQRGLLMIRASQLQTLKIEKSSLNICEAVSDSQLWAASALRVRSFYDFKPNSFAIQDHKKYLAEREFEALKERIAGKRLGFKRVSCIIATLPVSQISSISEDLSTACKISPCDEDRVVVASLDLNQCIRLPDELTGMKPEGAKADHARAYISNVCVAEELYRNGLGYSLVTESKRVAEDWGISDLYVHVAFDNEAAKNLYIKTGFVHENDEPAWQARFLDRPRRILLWSDLSKDYV